MATETLGDFLYFADVEKKFGKPLAGLFINFYFYFLRKKKKQLDSNLKLAA